MRIAILAPHAGYIVGGVETAAKGLRTHLLSKHKCEIFSLAKTSWTTKVPGIKGPDSPSLIRKLRLNYLNHFIPSVYIIKNYAFSEFSYIFNLNRILRRFNPDVILNFTFSIPALFCKYYRYKNSTPFINVGQSGCTYMEVKSAKTHPDVYVALSPVAKQYIEKRVPGVRVEVIPNGVNLNTFSPDGPPFPIEKFAAKSGIDRPNLNPPYILSTSRLVKEKRLDLLIKAVSRLKKGTLILVGHGEAKKRLSDLGNKILKNRILFLDTLNHDELSKLYRSCDVFSLPSKNEAFGNVIIEAMASGLPVVATNDPGFEWMVGQKGGILVDVTDEQAYARALHEAFEKNFENGPRNQAQNFSWEVVVQEYIKLCESILKDKK
jgi:glycosyltransferase involved in cell wall biosynthesis